MGPAVRSATDAAHDARAAAALLARHLAGGGRRWLLDLAPGGPPDAAALAAALDGAAGDPGRTTPLDGEDGTTHLRAAVTPEDLVVTIAADPTTTLRLQAWGAGHLALPLDALGRSPIPDAGGLARPDLRLTPVGDRGSALRVLADLGRELARTGAASGPAPTTRGEVCITCADEAVVAEVTHVADPSTAAARTADGTVGVDTTLVEPLTVGDLVLVHARTVLTRLTGTPATAHPRPEAARR